MSEVEPLEFSLKLQEIPFTVTDTDGNKKNYILRELNGLQRDEYLSFLAAKMKPDASGKPTTLSSADRIQSNLLSKAIFDPEKNLYVPEGEIRKWPSGVLQQLYKKIQKMSGLDEEAEEAAKND